MQLNPAPGVLTNIGLAAVKPRLLLADDHAELLREVSELLGYEFDVVATVQDGAALLLRAAELLPDVVVTDLRMPHLSGIEAGRRLLDRKLCRAVVLLTLYDDSQFVRSAWDAGIHGYVTKARAEIDLIPAIWAALGGKTFVSCAVGA